MLFTSNLQYNLARSNGVINYLTQHGTSHLQIEQYAHMKISFKIHFIKKSFTTLTFQTQLLRSVADKNFFLIFGKVETIEKYVYVYTKLHTLLS